MSEELLNQEENEQLAPSEEDLVESEEVSIENEEESDAPLDEPLLEVVEEPMPELHPNLLAPEVEESMEE
ncbi:MAG: hypothetical protein LBV67_04635, partial [Streptococcaceae bacterium]|nr:hypothetical protein [Streptococcaceae bacterium]